MLIRFIVSILFIILILPSVTCAAQGDKVIPESDTVISGKSSDQSDSLLTKERVMSDDARWWLKRFIEIVSVFLDIAIIVWQISRQHRNILQIQKENFKEKLRLEIYQDLIKNVDNANSIVSKLSAKSMTIPISLETYQRQLSLGSNPNPPRYRALELSEAHHSINKSIVCLFHSFESYNIAVPKFSIFQLALNSALHDAQETFSPFFSKLMKYLPMDVSESDQGPNMPPIIVPAAPNEKELVLIRDLGEKYNKALIAISSFLYDLTVEAQNILLGGLFENRVLPRQPLDPDMVVITTDDESIKKLEKYFNDETAWGKTKKQAKADALLNISKQEK